MPSLEETKELLDSEKFQEGYLKYQNSQNSELIRFLNNIDTNKKYYRIGINKNQRYKKIVTDDSQAIKDINSLINKLTEENYETLKTIIFQKIKAEYLLPYIIEKLIENAILHHMYIPLYVRLLYEIKCPNKNSIIIKICNKYYDKLFNDEKNNGVSTYENLCNENKKIDDIIGYSLLISHLEKEDIINDYIDKVLDPFVKNLLIKGEIDTYKMLVSFYSISQIHYTIIPERYKKILKELKTKTSSSKIKFKIMDILGE